MKEVMAFIRQNKINRTKEALAEAGFPSFTCRKCLGRGKKSVDLTLVRSLIEDGELPLSVSSESLTESSRLIPKRFFTLIVDDTEVQKVIKTIIDVNSTGNPGDGKIFVIPILESYRVRDGVQDTDTSY
jgi:nitrogen regulatory protein PII 2